MTNEELQRIKARVTPTICDTYRSEDGHRTARRECRISEDDFARLCKAIEMLDAEIIEANFTARQARNNR
jgi:crotonobetainyl-CoA:carnitine CoA-transferase CaiB-like acyl-CoA transferase